MMKMKGRNYKEIKGMPYVRREFIPGAPRTKIAKFSVGNPSQDYDLKLELRAKERAQIRHNALEAARVATNKKLSEIGEGNYYLFVKIYPHIVLRENKMIATAGADRLQEGMRRAFGKPIGLAARVEMNTIILEVSVKKENLGEAKDALKMAASKLPIPTYVKEIPLKQTIIEVKEK
ncbi:MAG: 50S ribosomal protein L16 [archaeon]|nr:50S ribosomal protein L16 [archaeon]MCP8313269.1 50S ribosomal protein L16 [archaeon]MCP8319474.1 50S ribosomal protein L16 [archaeon]